MNFVVAVDIGGSHVSALVASGDRKIRLEGTSTVPSNGCRKGQIVDEAEIASAIQKATTDALKQADRRATEVVVNISGAHVECVTGQGIKMIIPKNRQITNQDVMEVVNHSRAVLLPNDRVPIHVLPKTFKVDGQRGVKKPSGMPAAKLEVETLIANGDPNAVDKLERCVRAAGFAVGQVVFTPLASGLGILSQAELDQGVILVDIGATTTDIGVFIEGSMAFGASLPVGGFHISNDIMTLVKTSPEEGERLKKECGTALVDAVSDEDRIDVLQLGHDMPRPMAKRVLAEIIYSRVKEIASMAKASFDGSGYARIVKSGVVLAGNATRLPGTAEVFQEAFGMNTRIEYPARTTATAIGLARYAIQCSEDMSPSTDGANWKDKVRKLLMGG
jgi:cell division protein FtsA